MGSIGIKTENYHATELDWDERESYLQELGFSDKSSLLNQVLSVYISNPIRVQNYTDLLNKFIEKSPKYKGEAYRGIVTDKIYEVGEVVAENKISSWTTDLSVAREYSGSADYASENFWQTGKGQHAVIFVASDTGGTSISRFHSSGAKKYHNEIITDSKSSYEVTKIENKNIGRQNTPVQFVYVKRR